ncbi:hypothetical protein C2845_PM17G08010 [Panicum miliaceum]|uniref:SHSP domain-containing protein n=1 Tax=Panicum miliaceum TaxID=4540 RepID=A0A3L6Q1X1_PANMI|nr:hypothetical protein C2845_PM17G08010 [Panicum miliaceum]
MSSEGGRKEGSHDGAVRHGRDQPPPPAGGARPPRRRGRRSGGHHGAHHHGHARVHGFGGSSSASVDIVETPGEYAFLLDVPGLSKSHVPVPRAVEGRSRPAEEEEEEEGHDHGRGGAAGPQRQRLFDVGCFVADCEARLGVSASRGLSSSDAAARLRRTDKSRASGDFGRVRRAGVGIGAFFPETSPNS